MVSVRHLTRRPVLASLIIIGGILLFYSPTLTGGFLLDDHILVKNNPFVQKPQPFIDYFVQEDGILDRSNWDDEFHTGYYRPLINLTYFIDYVLWGMNPAGFRASNLFFHIVACLLLYSVLTGTCRNKGVVLVVTMTFALHPANTESVSWIASRNNILATLFSLAAFQCHRASENTATLVNRTLALLFFALAIFSKEFGAMALPLIFLDRWMRKRFEKKIINEVAGYLPYIAVLALYLWGRASVTGAVVSTHTSDGFGWRLAMAPYLAAYHLRLIAVPLGLHNFLVTYPESFWGIELAAGLLTLGLLFCLGWIGRKRPYLVFGMVAFAIGIFPVLNIVPTSSATLVAMRWIYFPFAFLCIALCQILDWFGGIKVLAMASCLVVAMGGYTYGMNKNHWHDETRFFTNEVRTFGNNFYAGALAEILWKEKDAAGAETYFKLGIDRFPEMIENYVNYSAMLIETGRFNQALGIIQKAMDRTMSRENRGGLYGNRGMALARTGRLEEAAAALETACRYAPDSPDLLSNLGTVYGMAGKYESAAAALLHGLSIRPDSIRLKVNLAVTRLKTGKYQDAARILESLPTSIQESNPSIRGLLIKAREGQKHH